MSSESPTVIEPGELVRGLLHELRRQVEPGGREEGGAPDVLQGLARALREQRDAAAGRQATRYGERTAGMRQVAAARQRRLEAYAERLRQAVPAEPGKYVLAGRLTDTASGVPLPNLVVRTSSDPAGGQPLTTHTDALGYFRLELDADAFGVPGTPPPELRLEVLDEDGNPLAVGDRTIRAAAGQSEFLSLQATGSEAPASLELGQSIARTLQRQSERLQQRERVLAAAPAANTPTVMPVHVLEVVGIGPVYAARLEEAGIRDAAKMADMEPPRLARILGIGEHRAAELVGEAHRLIRQRREQ